MQRMGIGEARASFCQLVGSRRRVIVTRNGEDVGAIVPAEEARILETMEAEGSLDEALQGLARERDGADQRVRRR